MTGLKNLFQEHYIDIPEEKVDLVDDLFEKVEDLENLTKQLITGSEMKKELSIKNKNSERSIQELEY